MRRSQPKISELLNFIAENEGLDLTLEQFPSMREDELRTMLKEAAESLGPRRPARKVATARAEVAEDTEGLRVVVNTDGASRGNPGPAGAGWVIRDAAGQVLQASGLFLGKRTNNEAEYEAVINALRAAQELGARDVVLQTDSELLVRQINGIYRVKNERLAQLHEQARSIMQGFRRLDVRHVRREFNADADAEANRAIDRAS
jgi:ribonuclease HI